MREKKAVRKRPGPVAKFPLQKSFSISEEIKAGMDAKAVELSCGIQDVARGCIKKALQGLSRQDVDAVRFSKPI